MGINCSVFKKKDLELKKCFSICHMHIDNLNIRQREVNKECCVCYKSTTYVTPCEHSVCLKCFPKIKPVKDSLFHLDRDEFVDMTTIDCPMCRLKLVTWYEDKFAKRIFLEEY